MNPGGNLPPPQQAKYPPPPLAGALPYSHSAQHPPYPHHPSPQAAPNVATANPQPYYGQQQQQQTQAAPAASSSQGIRDDQIPRVIAPDHNETPREFRTLEHATASCLPQSWGLTKVVDDGNASPRYMRMTTPHIPSTKDLKNSAAVPVGVVIQPFATPGPGEEDILLVDSGPIGIVRCGRCRAYVNCFNAFADGGRKMVCSICGASSDVSGEYFCSTDASGKRRDKYERPELCKGSVDFVATKEYCLRPPQPPVHLFLLDVSEEAAASGLLDLSLIAVRDGVQRLLKLVDGNEESLFIGFMSYDSAIHFYDIQPGRSQPAMHVVTDVDEPFCPFPQSCFAPYSQSKSVINSLLDSLPALLGHVPASNDAISATKRTAGLSSSSTSAAAMSFAEAAIKIRGGFVYAFQSSMPTRGPGKLKARDDPKLYNTDEEKNLLVPGDPFYRRLAASLLESQVSVYLFVCNANLLPVDIASTGHLAISTGGQAFFYSPFTHATGSQLLSDVSHVMSRPRVFECLMRVRASQGLAVEKYHGRYSRTPDDFDLPGLHSEQTFAVEFAFEGPIVPSHPHPPFACIQTALLYTTLKGERRVRVHTLGLPLASTVHTVFQFADLDAVVVLIYKNILEIAQQQSFVKVREYMMKVCIDLLVAYRSNCARDSPSGQLILPEGLKLLPLIILSITKHNMLKSTGVKADKRVSALWDAAGTPLQSALALVCARCVRVDTLVATGSGELTPQGRVISPTLLPLSRDRLDPEAALLFENGRRAWLWLGKSISLEFLREVCGVDSLAQVKRNQIAPENHQDPLSLNGRFHRLLKFFKQQRQRDLGLTVVVQGDTEASGEQEVFDLLVEDRSAQTRSYTEFLCHVHRVIQDRLK